MVLTLKGEGVLQAVHMVRGDTLQYLPHVDVAWQPEPGRPPRTWPADQAFRGHAVLQVTPQSACVQPRIELLIGGAPRHETGVLCPPEYVWAWRMPVPSAGCMPPPGRTWGTVLVRLCGRAPNPCVPVGSFVCPTLWEGSPGCQPSPPLGWPKRGARVDGNGAPKAPETLLGYRQWADSRMFPPQGCKLTDFSVSAASSHFCPFCSR